MKKIYKLAFITAIALALPFTAQAQTTLDFTQTTFTDIDSNGSITVTLQLNTTAANQITAVNYFLQELSAAGFYIISRSVASSPFSDTYSSDGTVDNRPGADLDPSNDLDLGAGVADQDVPATGSTTYDVATFTIGLDNVAPGTYTISTFSVAGSGWSGPGPTFPENEFDSHADLTITVIPEPTTWSLLGLGGLGALGLNLLRARRKG